MLAPPTKSGPRYDEFIQSDKVRVIDENGENLGVMYTKEAMEQANELGLNLVEVSPNAEDRRSVVWGKSVSVRVDLGGSRTMKKKKERKEEYNMKKEHRNR